MRSLPLNIQILAAPLALAIPIVFILIFSLIYLNDISEQNDTVREWARATDQLKIAKSATYQMQDILNELSKYKADSDKREELFFNYIEQSQFLASSLTSSDIKGKVSTKDLSLFSQTIKSTNYSEDINILSSIKALQILSPKLDYIYNILQSKKRALYINSNQDITQITSKLTNVVIIVLASATLIALIIAGLVSKNLKQRLASISQQASSILQADSKGLININDKHDELDEISNKLTKMSQRLNDSIDSENILQAAEDERQRIAMDIHDQFLSEITQLRREIDQSHNSDDPQRQLKNIDNTLERLNTDLRSLINDLFPHSLDILGLEASINDYISRKLSSFQNIDFFIQIDDDIESSLSPKQCLHLYRISIEVINNILKHAHCNRFELVFKTINSRSVLTIEDNGCGFDFTSAEPIGHIGMLSIKQRASILDTKATWQASRFSTGTCFKIVLNQELKNDSAHNSLEDQTPAYV